MAFKYFIADTFDGTHWGTNDDVKAKELSHCCEYFVFNAQNETYIIDGVEHAVPEKK